MDVRRAEDSGGRRTVPGRRWIVAVVVAMLLFTAYLYVIGRGPRDYAAEIARLLPARTSGFIALTDLDGIIERVGRTRLYGQLRDSVDLAALLMTSEDWRNYQQNRDRVQWKAKAALAREFLRRYFSREVIVALARLDGCDESALLVVARTELGFAEKLAELCASLYPELRLVVERYRGIPIYAYEGRKSKRSFTFVRFGRTVVLSLRSPQREYLRRIIDYRLDAPAQTLFTREDFRRARHLPARRRGLLAVIRPKDFLADLRSRPDFKLRKYLSEARQEQLERLVGGFRSIRAGATVGDLFELEVVLESGGRQSAGSRRSTESLSLARLVETVPSQCMGFAAWRFGNLARTLASILDIHEILGKELDNPKAIERAVGRLEAEWAMDINRQLAPALDRRAVFVLHDARLPMLVDATLAVPVLDRNAARQAIDTLAANLGDRRTSVPESFKSFPSLRPLCPLAVGFLAAAVEADYVVWSSNARPFAAVRDLLNGPGRSIAANPLFQSLGLPWSRPLDAIAFVNLEQIGSRAQGLLTVLALASGSVRERWAKYSKIIAVARLARCAGLYAQQQDGNWTIVLRVPLGPDGSKREGQPG